VAVAVGIFMLHHGGDALVVLTLVHHLVGILLVADVHVAQSGDLIVVISNGDLLETNQVVVLLLANGLMVGIGLPSLIVRVVSELSRDVARHLEVIFVTLVG
jgi:hypothetical protein